MNAIGGENVRIRNSIQNSGSAALRIGHFGNTQTNLIGRIIANGKPVLDAATLPPRWAIESWSENNSESISGDLLRHDIFFKEDEVFAREPLSFNALDSIEIVFPFESTDLPLRVTGGRVEIVVNSSLKKVFTIPPQTNKFLDGVTSVMTNGVFISHEFNQFHMK